MSEPNKIEEITESSGCRPKHKCKYLCLMVGVNLVFSVFTFCMLFNVYHEIKHGIYRFTECHPPRHKYHERNGNRRHRRQRDCAEEQHNKPESNEGDHSEPVEKD